MTGIIYRFYFPSTGKSYVGQTINPEVRYAQHFDNTKCPMYLIDYALRDNNDFVYEVLEDNVPESDLNLKEIENIKKYNAFYLWDNGGYNMTLGGSPWEYAKAEGRKRAKQEGKFVGGTPLFGYMIDKNKRHVVKEKDAKIVRKMYNEYLNNNITLKELGKKYHKSTPHIMLKNINYVGNEKYPQIIDNDLFDAVQEKINNVHKAKAKTRKSSLFKGIPTKTSYVKFLSRGGRTPSYVIDDSVINVKTFDTAILNYIKANIDDYTKASDIYDYIDTHISKIEFKHNQKSFSGIITFVYDGTSHTVDYVKNKLS